MLKKCEVCDGSGTILTRSMKYKKCKTCELSEFDEKHCIDNSIREPLFTEKSELPEFFDKSEIEVKSSKRGRPKISK